MFKSVSNSPGNKCLYTEKTASLPFPSVSDYLISINIYQYPLIYINTHIYIYIVGADDTVLCGRFSRGFLAHDMGFMYRVCFVFFT